MTRISPSRILDKHGRPHFKISQYFSTFSRHFLDIFSTFPLIFQDRKSRTQFIPLSSMYKLLWHIGPICAIKVIGLPCLLFTSLKEELLGVELRFFLPWLFQSSHGPQNPSSPKIELILSACEAQWVLLLK